MLDQMLETLLANLPSLIVVVCLLVGITLGVTALVGRVTNPRAVQTAEVVNGILRALAWRYTRGETMGRLLQAAQRGLGAQAGSAHQRDEQGNFVLVAAEGVRQLGVLSRVRESEPLVRRILAASGEGVVAAVGRASPWAALSDGNRGTLAAVRLGGERSWVLVLCWPDRGSAQAALPALRQIAWHANQTLAQFDDLDRQARDVREVNDELLRRDMLVRTTAHDMGNKATFVFNLLDALEGRVEADLAEMRERASQQLELLLQMLEDLTAPNRALTPAPVPVEELASLAAALVDSAACEFSLDVPPGLPPVWGERLAILRILDNLLRNAVRHNSGVPHLRVWLRVAQRGDWLEFEVGDAGQGIPLDAQGQLFEFGYRVDSSGKTKGHGLGLWSCKRLVQAQGGEISARSAPGEGTRFMFTLPVMTDERLAAMAEKD